MASPSPRFSNLPVLDRTGESDDRSSKPKVVSIRDGSPVEERISIEQLYPGIDKADTLLATSRRLIGAAQRLAGDAIALQWTDPVSADDKMSRLVPVLTELFCCRALGEGFTCVSNGFLHSVRNNASQRWSGSQYKILSELLESLNSEPYLSFDRALGYLDKMESVGLLPEPAELDFLSDWLDAQSVR